MTRGQALALTDSEILQTSPAAVLMDSAEARAAVGAINRHLEDARALVADLHDREGWRALGYPTWEACVAAEFGGHHRATVFRWLQAGQVERDLESRNVATNGLTTHTLVALAPLTPDELVGAVEVARRLSIRELRRLVADKVAERRLAVVRPAPTVVQLPDDPRVRLHQADARDLSYCPSGTKGLWVGSPPWAQGKHYDAWDDVPTTWGAYRGDLLLPTLSEAARVVQDDGGRVAISLPNRIAFPDDPWPTFVDEYIPELFREVGLLLRERITWLPSMEADSTAWGSWASASNPCLRAVQAPIWVASKGSHRRGPGASTIDAERFKRLSLDVWPVPFAAEDHDPRLRVSFPVQLVADLISFYTFDDDTVLDPFLGSGTSAIAAVREHRRFIGSDLDPKAIEVTNARLAREN